MKQDGIFIGLNGDINFEGEIDFNAATNVLQAMAKLQENLINHIIKQYLGFGVACLEELPKDLELSDEVKQEALVRAVKRLNIITDDEEDDEEEIMESG